MRFTKVLAPLLMILLVANARAQEGQTRPTLDKERKLFTSVERVGEDKFRSFFMFSVSGHDYTIRADGRGERSFENARSRNFSLTVDQGSVQLVYFLEYDGDLLLLYELKGQRGVRAYILRLNQKTLRTIWLTPLKDSNLETAVVEAGYLNLQAPNGVVKLDLQSGAFLEN